MKDLSLTVNIPFCVTKCSFCTKNVTVTPKAKRDEYDRALLRELDTIADELGEYRLKSIFFTGGTPTILAGQQLPELLREIKKRSNCADDLEVTVATNPGCIGINVLSRMKDYGLTRLEFSLGTVDSLEQDLLERHFGDEEMYLSREILEYGRTDNFSVDILRGQPGQTKAGMRTLMNAAFRYAPPAVAMYPLRYSESSALHHTLHFRDGRNIPNVHYRHLPYDETMLENFILAEELLAEQGLQPYTIYHYAKPGYQSQHHQLVRTDIAQMGLGLGAVTCSDGEYIRNTDDLDTYTRNAGNPAGIITEVRDLTAEEQMKAFMKGQLGLLKGFSVSECETRFGCKPDAAVLEALAEKGLLAESDGHWSVTAKGKCFSPALFAVL